MPALMHLRTRLPDSCSRLCLSALGVSFAYLDAGQKQQVASLMLNKNGYVEAVRLARLSFLAGASLWPEAVGGPITHACQQAAPGAPVAPHSVCGVFLKANAKADLQWDLQARLTRFRAAYGASQWPPRQAEAHATPPRLSRLCHSATGGNVP